MKTLRTYWVAFLAALALVLAPPATMAATTTNDILNLATFAENGFEAGFSVGLPILILLLLLGWLLLGLRTGIKGRK